VQVYIITLCAFGAVVLLTAWLPMVLKEMPLSLPIVCVLIGVLIGYGVPGGEPLPLRYPEITERLTEFVVIVALMGAGLKLDRPLGFRSWSITWRLLAITMPISIALIALVGSGLAGLPLVSALLLAALMAPTDPVLASDVQVGPPGSGEEDEVRFGLTSEAGLNDGLAFPFTNLAIAAAAGGLTSAPAWLGDWVLEDVLWKLSAGVAVGWLVGKALGVLTFRLPDRARLSRTGDGFVSLGITCLSYGLTELAHGYGFLAVFVTALALRHEERTHEYHEKLHDFAEQLERLLMMVVLVLFGIALEGGLLDALTWSGAAAGLLVLLVIRPAAGLAGMAFTGLPRDERLILSFYGIRGIGSFYYLSYALNEARFEAPEQLWALTAFIVLTSIVLHGVTVTPVIDHMDRVRNARH
jgi:sodium/hydrogen antiporter